MLVFIKSNCIHIWSTNEVRTQSDQVDQYWQFGTDIDLVSGLLVK